jgi:hypothetical protein
LKAYLDNNVVCALGNDDLAAESAALDELLDLRESGKVELFTSKLSKEEMAKCSKPEFMKLPRRIFSLLDKGPYFEDHTVLGFANQEGPMGTVCSYPLVSDDPISSELQKLGLDRTDAHHLMLAIRNECDFFVVCDKRSILNTAPRSRPGIQRSGWSCLRSW